MKRSPLISGGAILLAIAVCLSVKEEAVAAYNAFWGDSPDATRASLGYVPDQLQFPYKKGGSIFISGPSYADMVAIQEGYSSWNDYVAHRASNKMGEVEKFTSEGEFVKQSQQSPQEEVLSAIIEEIAEEKPLVEDPSVEGLMLSDSSFYDHSHGRIGCRDCANVYDVPVHNYVDTPTEGHSVDEPTTWMLLLAGIVVLIGMRYKKETI